MNGGRIRDRIRETACGNGSITSKGSAGRHIHLIELPHVSACIYRSQSGGAFQTREPWDFFLPIKNPCRKTSDRAHCVRYHLAMETDRCFLLDWAITEPPLFSIPQGGSKKGLSGDVAASFSAVFTIHCLSEKIHQPDSDPSLF